MCNSDCLCVCLHREDLGYLAEHHAHLTSNNAIALYALAVIFMCNSDCVCVFLYEEDLGYLVEHHAL